MVEDSSIFDEIVLPAILGQNWQESNIFMNICKRKDLLVVEIPLEILRDSTVEVNSTTAMVSRTKSIFVFNNNLKVNVVYNRKLT